MSVYEQNLQSLLKINPNLAARLFAIKGNEKFEVFVDENDPLNINILNNETAKVLYEEVPIRQIEEYLNSFEDAYGRYPYLYFFGVGNGVFFKALLQNEIHRRIVVVEPELEILYIAFHFSDFTQEIDSGRLVFLAADSINFAVASSIFMEPESRIFSKTYAFHVLLPFYEKAYENRILLINRIFLQAIEHSVRGLGNDSTDALIGLQHQVANVNKMVYTPTTMELLRNIKNSDTAVIISTGPSLKKQLPLLKTIAPYTTLICVDSSLPILERYDIKPDIVVSIERVIETAKFYKETSKAFQEDIVFVITSIAHPELFKEIKSGTLQISMRPFGYTSYFEMPEYGYLGIGMSAANLAYEMVYHGDFKHCILIGQDLAYGADGSTHSEGHVYGTKERKKSEEQKHIVTAYGGEGEVTTTLTWRLFKNFFESDIFHANQKGIITVNATEGGARIEGSVEMPFGEAIEKFVDKNRTKELISLEAPDAKSIEERVKKADAKIEHLLTYATKLQKEVETVFLHVAKECEIIESIKPQEHFAKLNFQNLADVMAEIDHVKDYFNDQEFANIFTDSTQAMILHQEIELATIQVRNVRTDDEKRQKMIDWVMAHRFWLFSLAGMMQSTIDAVNMGLEMKLDFAAVNNVYVYDKEAEIDVLDVKDAKNIFDIKRACIEYALSSEKEVGFYYGEKGNLRVQVHMPNSNDRHFSEFSFKNSLLETMNTTKFQTLSKEGKQLRVGFVTPHDVHDDVSFIELIQELYAQFPKLTFKVLAFKEEEREFIKELFHKEMDEIEFIAPKSVYELTREVDVFLYSLETTKFNKFYGLHNILERYTEVKVPQLLIENGYGTAFEKHIDFVKIYTNVLLGKKAIIEVRHNSELIDVINCEERDTANVFDVKQACIEFVSQQKDLEFVYKDEKRGFSAHVELMPRDDERYAMFAFTNSLQTTMEKTSFEGVYKKGAIGFFAVDENLEDVEFVRNIKEMMQEFESTEFTAFYFTSAQEERAIELFGAENISTIAPKSVLEICENIEVFYSNYDRTFMQPLENALVKALRGYSDDVFVLGAHLNYQDVTLKEYEQNNQEYYKKLFDNFELLGFSEEDKKPGNEFNKIFYEKASEKFGVKLDVSMDMFVPQAYRKWQLGLGFCDHAYFSWHTAFNRAVAKLK